jgi:hypothetical protein
MVNIIQRKSLEVPLIIMGVLVLTSFLPLIQILIMTLNGAVVSPLFAIANNDKTAIQYMYIFDSLMSLIGLILFYKSIKTSWRIFSAIFTVLFLLPLMVYIFGFIETDMYFVQNLVAGFAVGLILLVVALLKKNPSD